MAHVFQSHVIHLEPRRLDKGLAFLILHLTSCEQYDLHGRMSQSENLFIIHL